ncbi:hypothetical protein GXM_02334 [Nostoc sphaeroides CCNUC1]|uniref:Uncharacterized protein n=1 Tax=Nostoc sphaeroides CCNUC1 TaxID=2653204 RepID=A0A5P8VYG1_9NOSO|nr:hypothetical protein GXM_02334 [Nostoc sphaeroides CCNUC1]
MDSIISCLHKNSYSKHYIYIAVVKFIKLKLINSPSPFF